MSLLSLLESVLLLFALGLIAESSPSISDEMAELLLASASFPTRSSYFYQMFPLCQRRSKPSLFGVNP